MERLLDKAYKWMESFLLLVVLALMLTACKSQPPMRLDATTDKRRIRDRHAGIGQQLSAYAGDDSGTFLQLVAEAGGSYGKLGAHGVFTS